MRLNNFAESSLDILVIFHLLVDDYTAVAEREAVLLRIMDLAKDAGVEFAFPTRTLYVENGSGGDTAGRRRRDGRRSPAAPDNSPDPRCANAETVASRPRSRKFRPSRDPERIRP